MQCLGAVRLSPVRTVHALAPDPLFRGVEGARHLNEFIGRQWPEIIELPVDEWAALSLLFQTHVTMFWQVRIEGWNEALPSVAALAAALAGSGELLDLASVEVTVDRVADALWSRLSECVADVAALT